MATCDNTIRITSYNCRGAMSSAGYLDELMSSCDILCVQEHHLYYEHKNFLTTLNVNFSGHVNVCDENNPLCSLRLRKGGLAILWNNKINYSITNVSLPVHSDRIMAIRIDSSDSDPIFVINVYLPSTNYTTDQYRECITDWQITLEWLSNEGTVISCGDFNGQLG
jgi:exonuclease III